jgi:hypothetical protein
VKVLKLQNLQAKEQTIGQHLYGVAAFAVTLRGATPNLVAFLSHLERMGGQTLVVRSARFTLVPGGADLLIEVVVYTRIAQQPSKAAPPNTAKPEAPKAGR